MADEPHVNKSDFFETVVKLDYVTDVHTETVTDQSGDERQLFAVEIDDAHPDEEYATREVESIFNSCGEHSATTTFRKEATIYIYPTTEDNQGSHHSNSNNSFSPSEFRVD